MAKMKRSEMVKLMAYVYGGLHRGGWADASDEERMSEVLRVMEGHGVLPPETTVLKPIFKTTGKGKIYSGNEVISGDAFLEGNMEQVCNEWEPETENT